MQDSLLQEIRDVLCDIRQLNKTRPDIDAIVQISASNCYTVDYRNRYHIFLWSANALTLTLEDLGTLSIYAGAWYNVSFSTGMKIFAQGQNSLVPVFIRCTDTDMLGSISAQITQDYVESMTLSGRVFTATYDTPSITGDGWRVMSIFNPPNSGKTGVFYSAKNTVNYSTSGTEMFFEANDPKYSNTVIPINHDNTSSNTSVFSVTATTDITAIPSYASRIEYTPYSATDESIMNRSIYKIGPNQGVLVAVYALNGQEYSHQVKWAEY